MENLKWLRSAGIILGVILIAIWINPLSFNDATERTVVTKQNGDLSVQFEPGIFYAGFFAKEVKWPNQISVSYKDSITPSSFSMDDNTVEIGQINVRFNDATTAKVAGITQYILPAIEKEMLEIYRAHRTPEALVNRRLAPYTQECLQSSAQLISSEMHYSGGRAQMVQDYLDQLKNGAFLLRVSTINTYDSLEKANKKTYEVIIRTDKSGSPMRKFSSIKEYAINVGDAQITDVDYQTQVDNMLAQKIKASTDASISKQRLMTAQQQALTAKAEGERKLVETEYAKRVEQTNILVQSQTKVEQAKIYRQEQEEAAKAAIFAAQKVRTDADAEAYKNARLVSAGLTPWDKADFELQAKKAYYEALGKITLPTNYFAGGNSNSNDLLNALLVSKLATDK